MISYYIIGEMQMMVYYIANRKAIHQKSRQV